MPKFKYFDELFESSMMPEKYIEKRNKFYKSNPKHALLRGATEWLDLMPDSDIAYILLYMYVQAFENVLVYEADSLGFNKLETGEVDDDDDDEVSKSFRGRVKKSGSVNTFLSLELVDPFGQFKHHGRIPWWQNDKEQCSCTVDADFSWTLEGVYRPATHEEPAEHLEFEIGDSSINFIEVWRPKTIKLVKISEISFGYSVDDLHKIAKEALDCKLKSGTSVNFTLPEIIYERIEEIVSEPLMKQKIDKIEKNVQTKSIGRTFNL